MSDPLSDRCRYCGSPAVLDDAWFCGRAECWAAYENEGQPGTFEADRPRDSLRGSPPSEPEER